jgi:hypothetical protein
MRLDTAISSNVALHGLSVIQDPIDRYLKIINPNT